MELILPDAEATTAVGATLARAAPDFSRTSLLLTLAGELGTGKTTLARGLLRALGVAGHIRSPTFTLVEPYATSRGPVYHLDLYRLEGEGALEGLGYRDLRGTPGLVMVEWPERGGAALGTADLNAKLELANAGRRLWLAPGSDAGLAWVGRSRELLEENRVST